MKADNDWESYYKGEVEKDTEKKDTEKKGDKKGDKKGLSKTNKILIYVFSLFFFIVIAIIFLKFYKKTE